MRLIEKLAFPSEVIKVEVNFIINLCFYKDVYAVYETKVLLGMMGMTFEPG